MSLMQKRYRKLVKELVFVYTELEYVKEVLKTAHSDFESHYQSFCAEKGVPLSELNEKHKEKIERVIPQPKKQELDDEGLIKPKTLPPAPNEKVQKVFTRMYRVVTKKIHPDKFSNRELTPEIEEKIEMFKHATESYNSRNWGKFLDICEKLDVLPTRYDGILSLMRDEISNINKEIVNLKRAFSWRIFECEEDVACMDKVIKDFLYQLFKYKV